MTDDLARLRARVEALAVDAEQIADDCKRAALDPLKPKYKREVERLVGEGYRGIALDLRRALKDRP